MNGKHHLTVEGLEKFKSELDHLKNVERPRVIELIKEARTQGDLSENADYDAARDEQARLESRINELENIIKNAEVIETNGKASSNLGMIFKIKFEGTNTERVFTLVSSSIETDTDPMNLKISTDSPIGAKVANAVVGDKLEVKTQSGKIQKFKVIEKKKPEEQKR